MHTEIVTSATPWVPAPASLSLPGDEIHVWCARLDQPRRRVESLLGTLTPDEQKKAMRFYFEKHREHCIVSRGLLRDILSRYLDTAPDQLRFHYGRFGKPYLAGQSEAEGLQFNVSHSGELVLYAIAVGREVGVDVERIREDNASFDIAERFFSPIEVAQLRSLPDQLQTEAFFHCWTRKEAYVKGKGEGLSFPLCDFDVSVSPMAPAALLSTRVDPEEAFRWTLKELVIHDGYVAALAAEGSDWRVRCWEWTGE